MTATIRCSVRLLVLDLNGVLYDYDSETRIANLGATADDVRPPNGTTPEFVRRVNREATFEEEGGSPPSSGP